MGLGAPHKWYSGTGGKSGILIKNIRQFNNDKIQKCKEDLQEFHIYNEQIKHRTGRFLKLEIDSFYGAEAGLVYFAVNGKNSPTGDY